MKLYRFEANGLLFGDYSGATQADAQEAFAQDAGYESWTAMVAQAEEMSESGNTVEVFELTDNR